MYKISLVIFVIVAALVYPFGVIYALNTLFKLGIEYTFSTWIASALLLTLFAKNYASIDFKP